MKYLTILLLVLFSCSVNSETKTNKTKEEIFGCNLLSETKQNHIVWNFDLNINRLMFNTKINKGIVWVDRNGISVYFSGIYIQSHNMEIDSSCYDDLYDYLKRRYTGYMETEKERLKEKYLHEVIDKEYK